MELRKKIKKLWNLVKDKSSIISYLLNIGIGILELIMLFGIYLVLRQKFIEIQFGAYLLFLRTFFIWAGIIVFIQLFTREDQTGECLGRHLQVFLTIILISLGLVSGVSYLISNRPFVHIPNTRGGTFGFRAWNCLVRLDDIEVKIQNPIDSSLVSIEHKAIFDKRNWVRAFSQIPHWDKKTKQNCKTTVNSQNIVVDGGGLYFNLQNVGLLPDVKNGTIEANIEFLGAITGKDDNPNIEFCMRVPWNYATQSPTTDLYIGLQTHFMHPDWSKCWIPSLALAPSVQHHDSVKQIRKSTGFRTYKFGVKYRLKAVWFDDYVGLYLENSESGVTATLYEGKFSSEK